ncbi:MAG: hypothetical protein NTV44_03195 [Firmicutes bacterium]|nr:hypothetical protein [Bacillota bacterium]
MNKILTLSMLGLVAIGLAGCGTGGTTVAPAEANTRVVAATTKMASTDMTSFILNIAAEVNYQEAHNFTDPLVTDTTGSIVASGSLELKAKDMLLDTAEASLTVEASVTEDMGGTSISMTQSAAGYFKEGYAYANLTNASSIFNFGSEAPTKVKTYVGNIATALGIDLTSEVTSSELINPEMITPFVNDIAGVVATEKDGALTVTYTVTLNDVVEMAVDMASLNGEMPSSYTSSELDAMKAELLTQLESMIVVRKCEIVIGVDKDGYVNKFHVDVDVTVTEEQTDVDTSAVTDTVTHTVTGFVHIDLSNINQALTITFPSDLNTYVEDTPTN